MAFSGELAWHCVGYCVAIPGTPGDTTPHPNGVEKTGPPRRGWPEQPNGLRDSSLFLILVGF